MLELPFIIETVIAKTDMNVHREGVYYVPQIFKLLAPRLRVFKEFHVMWKAQSESEGNVLASEGQSNDAITNEKLQEMIEDIALQFLDDASWQDFVVVKLIDPLVVGSNFGGKKYCRDEHAYRYAIRGLECLMIMQ